MHPLEQHLCDTAQAASDAGRKWGAGDLAYLAGLWHDLGKYAPDWQDFLLEAGEDAPVLGEEQLANLPARRHGPDHSTAGAIHALRRFGPSKQIGIALQFAIAGHHAGLKLSPSGSPRKARRVAPGAGARIETVEV